MRPPNGYETWTVRDSVSQNITQGFQTSAHSTYPPLTLGGRPVMVPSRIIPVSVSVTATVPLMKYGPEYPG